MATRIGKGFEAKDGKIVEKKPRLGSRLAMKKAYAARKQRKVVSRAKAMARNQRP